MASVVIGAEAHNCDPAQRFEAERGSGAGPAAGKLSGSGDDPGREVQPGCDLGGSRDISERRGGHRQAVKAGCAAKVSACPGSNLAANSFTPSAGACACCRLSELLTICATLLQNWGKTSQERRRDPTVSSYRACASACCKSSNML